MMKPTLKRYWYIHVLCAVMLAVISFTVFGNLATSPDTHRVTIDELDGEKEQVTTLLAASTAASAVITMIPDDVGTPIAQQLAGLSSFFIFILSVLYAEKYLLTLIGFAVFRVLIPAACALYLFHYFWPGKLSVGGLAQKLVITGLVVYCLIPLGALVSGTIETTYHDSIEATIQAAVSGSEAEETAGEDKGWFQNLIDGVVNDTTQAVEWAKTVLNHFVEAAAVMLVTSCLIPFLVFLVVLLLLKKLFAIDTGSGAGRA